jgi:hypothetical protein
LPIYELVYCNNRQQAVAAAGFVSTKLFSPNLDGVQADNLQLLKDLVVFFREGQVHNHTAYLVDSFIDICPMLKDWGSMVNILLANECLFLINYANFKRLFRLGRVDLV